MPEPESLIEFPCRFPIKVMGRDDPEFEFQVVNLISEHVGEIASEDVTVRPSSKGTFVAITVVISATSREQLDEIYRSLTAHDQILYAI